MANRNFGNQTHANMQAPVRINFWWVQAAGVAIQVHTGRNVVSVTRTGAGLFDVVFADEFTQLYGVHGIISAAAANLDSYLQVAAYNAAAAGGATMSLRCKTGAANADPADADHVFVEVVFSNSSLNP